LNIGQWLADLGLSQYEASFRSNDIDAEVLGELTGEDLERLGVTSIGHRRKLLTAIAKQKSGREPVSEPLAASGTIEKFARQHEAERRQLTVMFVDLVGSTALSKRLDPEDMRAVLTAYQNAVAGAVTRFEGNVAKCMGDGVLCYFGYPHAHEDDAERAVRAGLAISQAVKSIATPLGDKLAARVGISTGVVVVGDLVGAGPAQEEAVVGDTPNLAARLQGLAAPGQVVLASTTRHMLSDLFLFADLGLHELKGITGETPAFAVVGERASESRFEARSSKEMSPLIGRDHELALMLERWNRAKAGEGQAILLTGEAGIGKSRLTRGMIDALAGDPHTRISYQCSPYHSDSPLYPTIQQLTFAAGFAPDDTNDDKLDRLEKLMIGAEADRPLLAALLGIDFEARYGRLDLMPQQQRTRTLDACVRQLTTLAAQRPVFFVIEDAHWIDPTTLELIDRCLDKVERSRVTILITARPTFQHGFGGHPIVTKLALNRLGRDQVTAIVRRITGGKSFPEELLEIIAEKTDGVPLFVEEITKTILESGDLIESASSYEPARPLNHVVIPTTLYDSLMARLDRLPSIKEVAQTAACIGRHFDYRLLKSIVSLDDAALQNALDRLTAAELIFRRGTPPDATYLFKHALVRDAAYENLLKTRRRTIHSRLLEVLERDGAAPEILAHHAAAAGMDEIAMQHWLAAGESAASRSANKEAAGHFSAGITLLDNAKTGEANGILNLRLHSALTSVLMVTLGYGSEEVGRIGSRTVELSRRVGDSELLPPVLWQIYTFTYTRAKFNEAYDIARALRDRTQGAADPTAQMFGHIAMGLSLFALGEITAALEEFNSVVHIHEAAANVIVSYRYGLDGGAVGYGHQGWCLAMMDRADEARQSLERLVERLNHLNHAFTLGRGWCWCSTISAVLKDWSNAAAFAERAIATANQYELKLVLAQATTIQGIANAALQKSNRFFPAVRESIFSFKQTGALMQIPFLLCLMAEVALDLGDTSTAETAISEALSLGEQTGERQVEPALLAMRESLKQARCCSQPLTSRPVVP
jgi:predicted ATPase/class 3 adenylate cyclase